MDTQQSLISDKLRECLRDKGYTAVSFAHKAGIPETEFRRFLKPGAFDNNEDEYEEMMDRTLKTLEITMEELLQYQSSTNKDLFFRAFVGETTESAMSSVGKREYELLHDILDLCTVYYAKEER